jgi:hypothetical protein
MFTLQQVSHVISEQFSIFSSMYDWGLGEAEGGGVMGPLQLLNSLLDLDFLETYSLKN